MENPSRIWLKIAVLLLAIIPIETGFAIQPALGEMAKFYAGVSPAIIGYILTLPAAGTVIFAIITGRLSVTMNKKNLLMVGLIFYLVGGVAPALYTRLWFVLACRALLGIGNGICMPLVQGFIAEFFEGNERASMMGYSGAVGAVAGIVITFAAGYIALVGWRWDFLLYLFIVVIFVMGWFALPDMKESGTREEAAPAERGRLTVGVFIIALIGFIMWNFQLMISMGLPMFITSQKIGNPAQIGSAMSLNMLLTFLVGLAFGQFYKVIKMHVWTVGIALLAVSALLLASAHGFGIVYVSMAIGGVGSGLLLPGFYVRASAIVAKSHQTFALGVVNAAMNLGVFTSAAVMGLVFAIVGSANYRILFDVILGANIIMAILVAIYVVITQARERDNAPISA